MAAEHRVGIGPSEPAHQSHGGIGAISLSECLSDLDFEAESCRRWRDGLLATQRWTREDSFCRGCTHECGDGLGLGFALEIE